MKERRHMVETSLLNRWGDLLNFILPLMFPNPMRLAFEKQENEVNDESSVERYKQHLRRWLHSNSNCI